MIACVVACVGDWVCEEVWCKVIVCVLYVHIGYAVCAY